MVILVVNDTSFLYCKKHDKWKEEGDEMTCCDQESEGELCDEIMCELQSNL